MKENNAIEIQDPKAWLRHKHLGVCVCVVDKKRDVVIRNNKDFRGVALTSGGIHSW